MAIPAYVPLGEGLAQAYATGYGIRQNRERHALDQEQVALQRERQNALIQAQSAEAEELKARQEMEQLYPLVKRRDPRAIEMALQRVASVNPQAAEAYKANPDALAEKMELALGIKNEAPKPTDDMREYELAKEQGFGGSFVEYMTGLKKAAAPATTVNVDTGRKFAEVFATKTADQYSQLYDQAQKAPELATRAGRVRQLLQKGAYTGGAANFKLQFGKFAREAGFNYAGDDLQNTEALVSELAATTLDAIAGSGLGSGQGFTDKDRQFLQEARAGNIKMERGTLMRLADLNERAAKITVQRWNDTAQRVNKANPGLLDQLGIQNQISGPQQSQGPVRVSSPEEAMRLPPGTQFVTPDGRIKVRP
jgi:hypothetical protein